LGKLILSQARTASGDLLPPMSDDRAVKQQLLSGKPLSVLEPPPQIGDYFDLSCNRFSGPIPTEFGQLSLEGLDLSGNQLGLPSAGSAQSVGAAAEPDWGSYETFLDYNMLPIADPFYRRWANTQTVPPTNVQASVAGNAVILTWTPIPYTADGGYYEVSCAAAAAGPFTVHGHTVDKTASNYTITGLTPGAVYYCRLRTFTPAHEFFVDSEGFIGHRHYQQNDLWSDYSAVVSIGGFTPTPTPTAIPTATETPTPTASETPTPPRQYWWLPLVWQ